MALIDDLLAQRGALRRPLVDPAAQEAAAMNAGGFVRRNLRAGDLALRSSTDDALAAAAQLVGAKDYAARQAADADELRRQAGLIQTDTPTFSEVAANPTWGGAARFAGGTLVQQVPQLAATLATAGLASRAGGVLRRAMPGLTPTAAAVRAGAIGGGLAEGAGIAGETYGQIRADAAAQGREVDRGDAALALGTGAAGAGLSAVANNRLFQGVAHGAGGPVAQRLLRRSLQPGQLLVESGTEGLQTAAQLGARELANPNAVDLFSSDSLTQIIDASAAGAVVGHGLHVGGGLFEQGPTGQLQVTTDPTTGEVVYSRANQPEIQRENLRALIERSAVKGSVFDGDDEMLDAFTDKLIEASSIPDVAARQTLLDDLRENFGSYIDTEKLFGKTDEATADVDVDGGITGAAPTVDDDADLDEADLDYSTQQKFETDNAGGMETAIVPLAQWKSNDPLEEAARRNAEVIEIAQLQGVDTTASPPATRYSVDAEGNVVVERPKPGADPATGIVDPIAAIRDRIIQRKQEDAALPANETSRKRQVFRPLVPRDVPGKNGEQFLAPLDGHVYTLDAQGKPNGTVDITALTNNLMRDEAVQAELPKGRGGVLHIADQLATAASALRASGTRIDLNSLPDNKVIYKGGTAATTYTWGQIKKASIKKDAQFEAQNQFDAKGNRLVGASAYEAPDAEALANQGGEVAAFAERGLEPRNRTIVQGGNERGQIAPIEAEPLMSETTDPLSRDARTSPDDISPNESAYNNLRPTLIQAHNALPKGDPRRAKLKQRVAKIEADYKAERELTQDKAVEKLIEVKPAQRPARAKAFAFVLAKQSTPQGQRVDSTAVDSIAADLMKGAEFQANSDQPLAQVAPPTVDRGEGEKGVAGFARDVGNAIEDSRDQGNAYSRISQAIHERLERQGISAAHTSHARFPEFNWRAHAFSGAGNMVYDAGTYLSTKDSVNDGYIDMVEGDFEHNDITPVSETLPLLDQFPHVPPALIDALKAQMKGSDFVKEIGNQNYEPLAGLLTFIEIANQPFQPDKTSWSEETAGMWNGLYDQQVQSLLEPNEKIVGRWTNDEAVYNSLNEVTLVATPFTWKLNTGDFVAYHEEFGMTRGATPEEAATKLQRQHYGQRKESANELADELLDAVKANTYGFEPTTEPEKPTAKTYHVTINATDDEIFHWQSKIGSRSEKVQKAFKTLLEKKYRADDTGEMAYRKLEKNLGQRNASIALMNEGVVGSYHNSNRGTDKDRPNYVVYDDSRIQVNYVTFGKVSYDTWSQFTPEQRAVYSMLYGDPVTADPVSGWTKGDVTPTKLSKLAEAWAGNIGITAPQVITNKAQAAAYGDTNSLGFFNDKRGVLYINTDYGAEIQIETLAHEMGHGVFRGITLSGQEAQQVRAAYEAWRDKQKGKTKSQVRASRATAAVNSIVLNQSGQTPDWYDLDFEEWFADNVGRWLTTDAKPVTAIERLFERVAQALKQLAKFITGQGMSPSADTAVAALMDKLYGGHGAQKHYATLKDYYAAQPGGVVYSHAVAPASPVGLAFSRQVYAALTPEQRATVGRALTSGSVRGRLVEAMRKDGLKDEAAMVLAGDTGLSWGYAVAYHRNGKLKPGPALANILTQQESGVRAALGLNTDVARTEEILLAAANSSLTAATGKAYNEKGHVQKAAAATMKTIDKMLPALNPITVVQERMYNTENPVLIDIANKFAVRTGEAGRGESYVEAQQAQALKRLNQVASIIEKLSDADKKDLLDSLRLGKVSSKPEFKAMQGWFDDAYKYAKAADPTLSKQTDYFPVVYDTDKLSDKRDAFVDMLAQDHFAQELGALLQLTPAEQADVNLRKREAGKLVDHMIREQTEGGARVIKEPTPFFSHGQKRVLDFIRTKGTDADRQLWSDVQSDDLLQTMNAYTRGLTKRTEYLRRFPVDIDPNTGRVLSRELDKQIALAKQFGASQKDIDLANDYVSAMMGTYGLNERPRFIQKFTEVIDDWFGTDWSKDPRKLRKAMGWVIAYQNLRLLALSGLSSVVDFAGIAMRTDLQGAVEGLREGFRQAKAAYKKTGPTGYRQLAETMGVVDKAGLEEAILQSYSSADIGPTARKINDALFRLNGLNGITRAMRVMALAAAENYIKRQVAGGAKSNYELQKLNITYDDIKAGNEQYRRALNRLVNEATIRPNAAQRPLWGSHPDFMLVFHLKQFMFSMHDRVLRQMVNQAREGNLTPSSAVIWYGLLGLAVDILADEIRMGDEDDTEKSNYGWNDHLTAAVERSGLNGVGQLFGDMRKNILYGGTGIEEITGPTGSQLAGISRAMFGDGSMKSAVLNAMPANQFAKGLYNRAGDE